MVVTASLRHCDKNNIVIWLLYSEQLYIFHLMIYKHVTKTYSTLAC